jgi:hypothetical protein
MADVASWTLDELVRRVAAVPDELIAAEPAGPEEEPAPSPVRRQRFWADPPAVAEPAANGDGADSVTKLAAVSLPGGALLLLPAGPNHGGRPDEDDIDAIRAAARPLLELLAERGLLSPDERSPS